jgi:hypothetical protein
MEEKITLKSEDFKYPTEEERYEIQKSCPKLENFDFKYNHTLALVINNGIPVDDASRRTNLFWWDYCLINRIGNLHATYIYTLTNYNRGFSDDYDKCTHIQLINKLLFDYYAEIFYYYFFSTRDIIVQILSNFYSLDTREDKLYFNSEFINKINNISVRNAILSFEASTKDAYEYRNQFAHRYTPNIADFRTVISDDKRKLSFGGGGFITSVKIVENINDSLNSLSKFIIELKEFVKD